MENINATNFERQKQVFNTFIEDTKDRLDLIIKDGIDVIFDTSSINLGNIVKVTYDLTTIVPQIEFLCKLSTPDEREIASNVINNYDEIAFIIKQYTLMFNHMSSNFSSNAECTSEDYGKVVKEIETLVSCQDFCIDGFKAFVKTEGIYDYYLHVDNYGTTMKAKVNMSYLEINSKTKEEMHVGHYTIAKDEFATDFAHQLITGECTHIKAK